MVRRVSVLFGMFYIGAAVIGHAKERRGEITCECQDGCWCKRPGLSVFRWSFPFGHKLR